MHGPLRLFGSLLRKKSPEKNLVENRKIFPNKVVSKKIAGKKIGKKRRGEKSKMRKLARIVKIDSIDSIPNADSIEVATIGGWKVVVKKGEFQVNDLAVYCEVDSWIPYEIAPFLVSNGKEPREFNGVKGERLRTVKLRGTTSQGLLLKLEDCFDIVYENSVACINTTDSKTTRSVNDNIQDNQ
jgi:hypothetical protein